VPLFLLGRPNRVEYCPKKIWEMLLDPGFERDLPFPLLRYLRSHLKVPCSDGTRLKTPAGVARVVRNVTVYDAVCLRTPMYSLGTLNP
jgi:hypothetical protein